MSQIVTVPWERIRPMPEQPRSWFDPGALEELAASIKAQGQRVPVQAVAVAGDPKHDYELVDGQRRWHAAQIAGVPTLRVEVVVEPDPEERFALSVTANFCRAGHHPLEIARACERLARSRPVAEVAARLGKSTDYVYQHLSLLKLVPDLQRVMHPAVTKKERLPFSAAVKLAALPPGEQWPAYEKARDSGRSMFKATVAVLETAARTTKRPYGRNKGRTHDVYRVLRARLSRAYFDVETIPDDRLADVLAPGRGYDLAALLADVDRLAGALAALRAKVARAADGRPDAQRGAHVAVLPDMGTGRDRLDHPVRGASAVQRGLRL